jgi:hypothetical protein
MLILFDQATPVPMIPYPMGHSVRTAAQEGWDRLKNGELLGAAERAGFDLILTTDRNMPFQQNLARRKIAVMVLTRQQWPQLLPHVDLVIKALSTIQPGTCTEVEIPGE